VHAEEQASHAPCAEGGDTGAGVVASEERRGEAQPQKRSKDHLRQTDVSASSAPITDGTQSDEVPTSDFAATSTDHSEWEELRGSDGHGANVSVTAPMPSFDTKRICGQQRVRQSCGASDPMANASARRSAGERAGSAG